MTADTIKEQSKQVMPPRSGRPSFHRCQLEEGTVCQLCAPMLVRGFVCPFRQLRLAPCTLRPGRRRAAQPVLCQGKKRTPAVTAPGHKPSMWLTQVEIFDFINELEGTACLRSARAHPYFPTSSGGWIGEDDELGCLPFLHGCHIGTTACCMKLHEGGGELLSCSGPSLVPGIT